MGFVVVPWGNKLWSLLLATSLDCAHFTPKMNLLSPAWYFLSLPLGKKKAVAAGMQILVSEKNKQFTKAFPEYIAAASRVGLKLSLRKLRASPELGHGKINICKEERHDSGTGCP